jgi:hypothetical protein
MLPLPTRAAAPRAPRAPRAAAARTPLLARWAPRRSMAAAKVCDRSAAPCPARPGRSAEPPPARRRAKAMPRTAALRAAALVGRTAPAPGRAHLAAVPAAALTTSPAARPAEYERLSPGAYADADALQAAAEVEAAGERRPAGDEGQAPLSYVANDRRRSPLGAVLLRSLRPGGSQRRSLSCSARGWQRQALPRRRTRVPPTPLAHSRGGRAGLGPAAQLAARQLLLASLWLCCHAAENGPQICH